MDEQNPPIRVMALHALAYCERLFYLEEVEEIRIADDRVYAGRTLHEERAAPDPSGTEWRSFQVSSESLGLTGRLDAARQRDGSWIPYENKRGRARSGENGGHEAWTSDRLQIILYESRLEESWKHPVLNYSLSYGRTIELEVRLLEKEWTGEPGLFGRARIR